MSRAGAADSVLSTEPSLGLERTTLTSGPEPTPRVRPPRAPQLLGLSVQALYCPGMFPTPTSSPNPVLWRFLSSRS